VDGFVFPAASVMLICILKSLPKHERTDKHDTGVEWWSERQNQHPEDATPEQSLPTNTPCRCEDGLRWLLDYARIRPRSPPQCHPVRPSAELMQSSSLLQCCKANHVMGYHTEPQRNPVIQNTPTKSPPTSPSTTPIHPRFLSHSTPSHSQSHHPSSHPPNHPQTQYPLHPNSQT